MQLKVMTYNIHSGIGTDDKADWQRIAELIRQEAPDLLALQEVTVNHARTQELNLPQKLAEDLNMKVCFGKAISINENQGEYGVAALSPHPIELLEKVFLPTPPGIEKRIFLVVKVQMKQPVYFVVTHFSYQGEFPGDEEYRTQSAQLIRKTIDDKGYEPVLWAGDFNTVQGSSTLDFIQSCWDVHNNADPDIPTAHCQHAGWRQIDFICSSPQKTFQCLDFRVIDDLLASDHRPVCARLSLAE